MFSESAHCTLYTVSVTTSVTVSVTVRLNYLCLASLHTVHRTRRTITYRELKLIWALCTKWYGLHTIPPPATNYNRKMQGNTFKIEDKFANFLKTINKYILG